MRVGDQQTRSNVTLWELSGQPLRELALRASSAREIREQRWYHGLRRPLLK